MRRALAKAPLLLAALTLLFWLALGVEWFRGVRRIPVLRDVREPFLTAYPPLAVIVAARDEERAVGESVRSMLAQDYPGPLEVVAVDDRSADRTGGILESLRAEHPSLLRVLRVEELPEGWLGKTHALALGAAESKGDWLLFTDADVRFAPDGARRAVGYAVEKDLAHLALAPDIFSGKVLLGGFVAAFGSIFVVTQRPWRARDPGAREHVGIGAFNLVRRRAYLEAGTHRAIRMRPDDDMKLAKLLKREGFRQDVVSGAGLVSVEWHRTVRGAVRGLTKSMFPSMGYRLWPVALATPLLLLANVFPFAGVFLACGAAKKLSGLNVALISLLYAYQERRKGLKTSLLYAVLHPFSMSVFVYAMLRSACTTLANGGIEWRGTWYPLERLRENEV